MPSPATQLVVAAARRTADGIDSLPPAPDEVDGESCQATKERKGKGPVPYDACESERHGDQQGPLDYLPPCGRLDLEDREDGLPDHRHRQQNPQLDLDPHHNP